jgi:hypothetical protein
LRERFEFYGERLVTLAVESGGSNRIGTELADLGQHNPIAQQEDRQETVEWAPVMFVVASVVLEIYWFWIGR